MSKLFKGGGKWLQEMFFYFLNVTLESVDDEKGWKQLLFLIPVIFALCFVVYLLVIRPFL